MALSAVFKADFSSFYDAVQKAEVKLVDLSEGAGKVGTSLDKMTKSFSGQKIIQDAHLMTAAMVNVGGITSLTDKELRKLAATVGEASDKMRKMGVDVPPGFQKITDAASNLGSTTKAVTPILGGLAAQLAGMFTIGAIVAFGKEVLAAGDKIQKMADQTGLGTVEVQRLQYVAGQSGVSMDTLVSAVQNLQQRLGDDNTGAAGAMKKLGINADAFAKLNTYQQVLTLSDALRQETDVNERASIGAAIFGKTWKEVGPAITANMRAIGDEAPVMADETVKALDRVGDALLRAKGQAVAWGGLFVTAIEGAGFAFGDFLSKFNPAHLGLRTSEVLKLQVALNDPHGLSGAFSQAAKAAEKLEPAIRGVKDVVEPTAYETQVFNERLQQSVKANEAAAKAAEETKKKYADWLVVLSDHNFMLTKWQGTIVGTIPALGTFNERIDLQEDLLENGVRTMELMRFETDALGKVTQVAGGAFQGLGGMTKTFSDQAEDAAKDTKRFEQELGELAAAFVAVAQVSGDSMADVSKHIGSILASMDAASKSAGVLSKALNDLGTKGNTAKGLAGVAAGAIGVYGAFQQATSGTSKLKSALGGAAVGFSVAGPWGAAVGAAIGLIKSFAKASEETAKVSPLRDVFFKAAGGLEKLNPQIQELTGSLDLVRAVFDAKTAKDYEAAVAAVNEVLGRHEEELRASSEAMKEASVAIEEMRGKYTAVEERLAGFVTISPEVKAALDLAFNAATPEAYKLALDEVNTALDAQAVEAKFLEDTMKKYGISWTSLGVEARNAKVAEISRDIIKEFDVLNKAGVNVNEIMKKMGPSVNEFVKEARLSGTEVPEQFRKIIQAGIDAGVIFGDNKNKITDMKDTGIAFGTSMEETMKKASESMAASIEKLVKVLEDKLIKNLEIVKIKTEVSEGAFEDWAETAVDAADDVSDAVDDVSFGHSPGGLKEFPILLKQAETAFRHFSRESTQALTAIDKQLKTVTTFGPRDIPAGTTFPRLPDFGTKPPLIERPRIGDGGEDFGGGKKCCCSAAEIHAHVYLNDREIAEAVGNVNERNNQLRRKVRAA